MSLFTVTPTGVSTPIEVYGGTQALSDYLLSSMSDGATAFVALTTNQQAIVLVAATRFIERLVWQGTPTSPPVGGTTLSWPRTGIVDEYNNAVDPNSIPEVLLEAVFELAGLIADDPDVQTEIDSGSNLESLAAGSARLQFFRPTSAQDGNATVLPQVVDQLVGMWLASAAPAVTASLNGTANGSPRSDFETCWCGQIPCCCWSRKRNVGWAL